MRSLCDDIRSAVRLLTDTTREEHQKAIREFTALSENAQAALQTQQDALRQFIRSSMTQYEEHDATRTKSLGQLHESIRDQLIAATTQFREVSEHGFERTVSRFEALASSLADRLSHSDKERLAHQNQVLSGLAGRMESTARAIDALKTSLEESLAV